MKLIICFVITLATINGSSQSIPVVFDSERVERTEQGGPDSVQIKIDTILSIQREMQKELRDRMFMAELPYQRTKQ